MMELLDEKFVEMKREAKKEKYCTPETGMIMKDEIVEFSSFTFYDKKMSIMLPKEFVPMPLSLAKMKYQSESRPEIIMTSLDTTVNCAFTLTDQIVESNNQLKTFNFQASMALRNQNPAITFFASGDVFTRTVPISWFEFKSFGIDLPVYNLFFFANINGKALYAGFNCPFFEWEDWQAIAHQIMLSIKSEKI